MWSIFHHFSSVCILGLIAKCAKNDIHILFLLPISLGMFFALQINEQASKPIALQLLSTDINSNELMHPIIPYICAFLIDANTSHQPLIKQCRMYVKMLMDFSSSSTRKFLIFPSFMASRLHWTIDSKTSLKELLFVFGIHGTLFCTGVHPFTIAQ